MSFRNFFVSLLLIIIIGSGWLCISCSWFGTALHTVTDIAHVLCMLAASERTEAERSLLDDDGWCAAHAIEYVDEVTKAKSAAGKRAGLGK